MRPMTTLGKITLTFAVALLKEQATHPAFCHHCTFWLSGMEGQKGVVIVHEDDCPVTFAEHFMDEFNKEIVSN